MLELIRLYARCFGYAIQEHIDLGIKYLGAISNVTVDVGDAAAANSGVKIPMASNKSFVSSPMVDDCDSYTSDEIVQSKVTATEVLADVDGSESKGNDVDSVVKDKIFVSGEDVDSNVKKVDIKDDDGNVVVSDEKLFNGDEDVEISQQNYVVTGDKMLVSDEDLYEAKRSDTGDVDMVPVSDENMSVSDDGVKSDFVVVPNLKLMAKEIQLSENEMIEVVSVKETIIISDDDEVLVFGSSEKKAVSDYTFSSNDDNIQIVCGKNSNGKCCHDDPFSDENVQDLHLIPHQPVIEEDQLDLKVIPIEDHSVSSDTLERLNYYKAAQDQLNYMHQLIAHGLINGLKLDYGGEIFNDLAAKLYNSVRHPSPAYARFISFILEKALGDNYVISEEIALKIPLMGNSTFNLELTSSEVSITCYMDRVCKSVSEACLVSEDVPGLDLCDNVYDGSPSEDPKFNEIIQNVKTKTMSSLLDPNSIATTDVYQYKVVMNVLNEDVIGESAIPSGSCDHNLKDDCHGKANEISDCLNEEVIDQSAIHSGTGDQNLKDDCPGKTIEISNCLSEEVVYQSAIPSGSDDQNLKDNCPDKTIDISNCLSDEEFFIFLGSDDHNLKVACHVNSNEVCNIQNHVESDNQLQSESNVYAFMLKQEVSAASSSSHQYKSRTLVMSKEPEKINFNKRTTSSAPSTESLDEINELKKSSSSKSSIDQVTRDVISAIHPELKSIKEHISSIQIPSFPSEKKFELVDEVNKLGNSSLSNPSIDDINKAVVGLLKLELEVFIKSVTDLFFKTKVNINVPEDILRVGKSMKNLSNSISSILSTVNTITQRPVQLSPEFATLPEEIQRFRSSVNDIVTFKVEISNLAKNNHENVSMFKELSVYFSNLQKDVNDFKNRLVESVPSKKERLADQQLMEYVASCEVAKRIFVDGSASASKTRPGCEKSSFKLPVFNRDVTELSLVAESNVRPLSNNQETTSSVLSEKDVPKGDPQGQTSFHVEVEAIHSTSVETYSHQNVGPDLSITNVESCENVTISPTPSGVSEKDVVQGDPQGQTCSHVEVEALHSSSFETDGHQNVYPESSNKNVESCENVTVSSIPSDKQVGTFEYEVGGVKYLMTPEEIAKQKDDEEIIKRKDQEEKASYAKIVNVLAKDERNLHIRRVSAIRDEEDHNLEVKYKNRKIIYDKYVRALNPQCRRHPEKITVVDIISRKGLVCVTIYRASLMVIKAHAPLKLKPTSSEVLITCHMDRVCKSISEACLVYEDVAGLNLFVSMQLDRYCYGQGNEISNCLKEEVIDQSGIHSGSDDHNLKVDCHVNSNEVSNMQNHVESDNQLQSESNVICGFNYLEKGLEYDNEPSFEEIQATILNVGYIKVGKPSQPFETTLLKTGFSPTWKLLMAYISNSLGVNEYTPMTNKSFDKVDYQLKSGECNQENIQTPMLETEIDDIRSRIIISFLTSKPKNVPTE
ncbi:hypothetical protein Tco_1507411 [Tanacetum coccineum]